MIESRLDLCLRRSPLRKPARRDAGGVGQPGREPDWGGNSQAGLAALAKAAEFPGGSAESEDHIGFLLRFSAANRTRLLTLKNLCHSIATTQAHYHLGVARWLAKDHEGGLPELENAVKLSPSIFDYRFRLGSAYLEIGHYEQASRPNCKRPSQSTRHRPPHGAL